jgi:hypothetical protein
MPWNHLWVSPEATTSPQTSQVDKYPFLSMEDPAKHGPKCPKIPTTMRGPHPPWDYQACGDACIPPGWSCMGNPKEPSSTNCGRTDGSRNNNIHTRLGGNKFHTTFQRKDFEGTVLHVYFYYYSV